MILMRSSNRVTKVEYRKGRIEVIGVQIKEKNGERHKIVVTYVHPKTRCWTAEEHEQMLKDTLESLEQMIRTSKTVTLVG